MNISRIERTIVKAEELLAIKQAQLDSKKSDFALSLSMESLQQHINDLQFQLMTEKEKRGKEVVELRLIGGEVNNGTVPLDIFANLAKTFSGLISSAAARIKNGHDLSGAIPREVTQPINLRFAEIGHGSSRLFITGDTSPDIFGDSLLENTLSGFFDLLNKDMNLGLSDQVDYLGLRSSHNIAEFLKVLRKKSIEIDISWTAPNETKYFWNGRRDKIQMLETLLDGFNSSDPTDATINGVVDLISRSGKLTIKDANDELIKIGYTKKLYDEVRKYRLGDSVTISAKETVVYNSSTQEEKKKYNLIDISSQTSLNK